MKFPLLVFTSICLLASCKETPVANDPPVQTACTLESSRISKNGFNISGGRFAGVTIELDSIVNTGSRSVDVTFEGGTTTLIQIYSEPVAIGTDTGLVYMSISFPGRSAGTYQLNGPNAGGVVVSFNVESVSDAYFPLRGTLEVGKYDWTTGRADLSGRFCGTFKNAAGDTVQITGGSFNTVE